MRLTLLSLTLLMIAGCSSNIPTPLERKTTLLTLASQYNLTIEPLQTSHFTLFAIMSDKCDDKTMRVYIEGDGLSWVTRSRLSDDPTPINPLAAKLMFIDPSTCKAYIARPCQYTKEKGCNPQVWSSHRFSHDVIDSYNDALQGLKKKYNLSSFTLIGYSGGGAVAALLAAKREDVSHLITVAGNLDTDKWVELHALSPLEGSLNPAQNTKKLETIPQYHLIGTKDEVVPKEVFLSYQNRFDHKENVKHTMYDATHTLGWVEHYQQFLKEYLKNEK